MKKKIVRLTENDLTRIVKKVINEQSDEFQRRSDKVKNYRSEYIKMLPKKKQYKAIARSNNGTLDLSGEQMDMLPDLSDSNAESIIAIGCGINTMPPVEHLPQSLQILTLSDNDITEADMEGYRNLPNLFVINLYDNDVQWVNWEEVSELPRLARLSGAGGADNFDEMPDYGDDFGGLFVD
jgi:Leucine-rich repeat (LRR) protein